ncbi:MAG: DUF433 domain-containing protein [Gemmatimonadetes bacterium]|nr:DUF433 domain-containing protein [Gemmatimonadota bacterium]
MRALYQVISRAPGVRRGVAVFAGTRVPVKSLIDHLDRGGSIDEFLQRNRDLPRDTLLAACALGLESLVATVPLEPAVTQASLLPRTDAAGVIINPEELGARAVVGRRVRCPACRTLVFKSWPEGWDGHAARKCRGLKARDEASRKAEFKRRYEYLFR